jgi:hypothetical protein
MARVSIFLKSGWVSHSVTPTPFVTLSYETSTPQESLRLLLNLDVIYLLRLTR